MPTNKTTIEEIIKVLLKHVDRKTAARIARELYENVPGSKSMIETFHQIAERLEVDHD